MNTQSEDQAELFAALATAQGQMESPKKVASNPYFKSNYAPLSECIRVSREPLAANGLCCIQEPTIDAEGGVTIRTTLAHSSGQWRASELTMHPDKSGPQALGVVITYGRRYGYCAMIGLAQEDEDGGKPSPEERPEVSQAAIDGLKKKWWAAYSGDYDGADRIAISEAFAKWVHEHTRTWPKDGWTAAMATACHQVLDTMLSSGPVKIIDATEAADLAQRLASTSTPEELAAADAAETVTDQTPTVESWEALFALCPTPEAVRELQIQSVVSNPGDELAVNYASKQRIKELA